MSVFTINKTPLNKVYSIGVIKKGKRRVKSKILALYEKDVFSRLGPIKMIPKYPAAMIKYNINNAYVI